MKEKRISDRFRFRVWNDESKRYESFPWHIRAHNSQLEVEGEHLSLEQCTGHKDINGTLIFEGDFVNLHYTTFNGLRDVEHEMRGMIKWDDFGFVVVDRYRAQLNLNLYHIDSAMDIEILGNIHENPELMEG